MKRIILLATMFATVLSLSAQRNMQVWEDGSYSEFPTTNVDSVTFLLSPNGTPRTYVTPQFKIESDYWYVSYDEGWTWTQLGKATGEQGEQGPQGEKGETGEQGEKGDTGAQGPKGDKGDKGDSMFLSVTQDDNYIYLLMTDSTKIQIAKANKSDSMTFQPNSEFLFEVTYDANGGVGYMSKDTFYYGMFGNLQYCKFTYKGRNFAGWNTKRNGTGVSYNNVAHLMISKDITLYAQWPIGSMPLSGNFSISDTQKVSFSKGNLQYNDATRTWRFAENQTDYIGDRNSKYGWMDLFGWGTGNNPINTSKDNGDYQTFVDWGTNIGTDSPNVWRTLTADEWYYIFYTRTNAKKLFGLGSVDGVNGLIILPDNWAIPDGVTFTPSTEKGLADRGGYYDATSSSSFWSHNTYTLSDWQKLEDAGAVFLPAAGSRDELFLTYYVQSSGCYWSSTTDDSGSDELSFSACSLSPKSRISRYFGRSVRLVQDVK